MIELSPLSIIKKRKLGWKPPHFNSIQIRSENDFFFDSKEIIDWIDYKLKGRYCVYEKNIDKHHSSTFVGFEDEKELTYFMLACPYIRR
jgi:hypothetical protein